jgi:hypothetical protein
MQVRGPGLEFAWWAGAEWYRAPYFIEIPLLRRNQMPTPRRGAKSPSVASKAARVGATDDDTVSYSV